MEQLITSYGVDFITFKLIIKRRAFIITGGVALASYLKQEEIDYDFNSHTIDIFVQEHCIDDIDELSHFLISQGFTVTYKYLDHGCVNRPYITMFTKNEKYIRLISVDCTNLKQYIIDAFDLSICITWWDADKNIFETLTPEYTKRKEMYIMYTSIESPETYLDIRIELYTCRGFTLIASPRRIINCADSREAMRQCSSDATWQDITAYDIISLEEYNIKDFLLASPNNIILKSGERYYAFDCYILVKYMWHKLCYINDTLYNMCETPLSQCVTKKAVDAMLYADYTIYEITGAYKVRNYKDEMKTIYNLHCYSVDQWINGRAGVIIQTTENCGS